jgi:hypothetical protein
MKKDLVVEAAPPFYAVPMLAYKPSSIFAFMPEIFILMSMFLAVFASALHSDKILL